MFQMKEQHKIPGKNPHETETSNLPDKRVQNNGLKSAHWTWEKNRGRRENFNKELENMKKNQSELKNAITEMKTTGEGINNRLDDIEVCMSDLEERIVKITKK